MTWPLALTVQLLLATLALATVNGPVINANFPDPSILQAAGTTYAFSTNSGSINIQVATSPDGGNTWTLTNTDALPDVGSWATTGNTWAPDVIDRGDGTYVMYYAAESPSQGTHCVGAATSTNPEGPYTPQSQPIACQTAGGGAIDPAGFQDTDGTLYVVYKVDGNNLGGGGTCGNGNEAYSTPIMLQQLLSDGVTPTGNPVQILDRGVADGPLIEAPALILHQGTYVLFFSSNCYNTNLYDISYATASSVSGPYTKASSPLLVTGDDGLTSPGGATPLPDGSFMVFHATTNSNPLTRPMYTATMDWNGVTVSV
ncbi:glycoside hydrolase family 43 protein [Serpula lacrymans var. lacrymans S7.3]|uniref:Glycoside hydrolase family 43 protein n=2 Tax=Serpula lacrymans var. lacrymans TaxID=341189 RepID=F8PJ36_SERL3|nr:glycoside hydrolase family 43 protein [Serpula lacrymans var. lacrymans S7.9]EGO03197.1 glycoside hydrolase family 43 protein [Serpula lacrymans var. lacrymans S7.3]EGO28975.1 glycoside hydrolase family 43 protein [Serpula lacrymans var. lacrymans S7.9]